MLLGRNPDNARTVRVTRFKDGQLFMDSGSIYEIEPINWQMVHGWEGAEVEVFRRGLLFELRADFPLDACEKDTVKAKWLGSRLKAPAGVLSRTAAKGRRRSAP